MPLYSRSRAAVRVLLLSLLTLPLSAQSILNRNLILNGDAESGPAAQSPTDPKVSSVPNWTSVTGPRPGAAMAATSGRVAWTTAPARARETMT